MHLKTIAAVALLAHAPFAATTHQSNDIVETAIEAGSFETLAAALGAAGLVDTLQGDGPFTVFAPTDDAFAKLPKETVDALLRPENKDALIDVLTYHVVSGNVSAQDAVAAGHAEALQSDELTFRIQEGRLKVNDAQVVTNDIECSNGTIHVIDSVLLPPGGLDLRPAGRLIIGVYFEQPSRALAEQLGLDRHGSLVLTKVSSNGPSDRAGLKKYDIITAIDGEPATDNGLKRAKERAGYGGPIELTILRRGQHQTITVEVGIDPH